MKKIYLAGPNVFLPPAVRVRRLAAMIAELTEFDLLALYPGDLPDQHPAAQNNVGFTAGPVSIFARNLSMLSEADGLIADLAPFRGPSVDVGTAWEIGFAYARRIGRVSLYPA